MLYAEPVFRLRLSLLIMTEENINEVIEEPVQVEESAQAAQSQSQASGNVDVRRRLRELLSIPERERTDEIWDEIIELEIQTAPGNRLPSGDRQGGYYNNSPKSSGQQKKPHRPRTNTNNNNAQHNSNANAGSGGNAGQGNLGKNRRPRGFKGRNNNQATHSATGATEGAPAASAPEAASPPAASEGQTAS